LILVQFNAWLDPPEEIGRERDETVFGVPIADGSQVAIHAVNFLENYDAGSTAGFRQREISR